MKTMNTGPNFVANSDSVIVELSIALTTVIARSVKPRENDRTSAEKRKSHVRL